MNPNILKIIAWILVGGFGYAGYEFYDFYSTNVPQMESERQGIEAEVTKKQGELKKLQFFAENIETIKQELRALNLQLESAMEHMPKNFNLSGLLRKLTMLAQNSGLEIFTFRPGLLEEKVASSFYSSVTIFFDLRGTFTQTLVFLDQVARLKRIVNIENVRMVADSTPRRVGSVLLNSQAIVRTYRISD